MSADIKIPFLRYMLLCGEVDVGEDGRPDAYGILSETTIVYETDEPLFFELQLYFMISIYTEDESETYPIVVAVKTPTGHEGEAGRFELGNLEGKFTSTTATPLSIEMNKPGTYWVKAYCQEQLLGEISLIVKFLPATKGDRNGH